MLNFLKNALLKGLVILIPVVILYVTLRELLELMVGLATPIADLFPEGTFDRANETEIIAVLLVIGTAIILGSLSAIKPAGRAAAWLEDKTLNAVPMYRMLKSLMAAMLNVEGSEAFKPAFHRAGNGTREPVYVIEQHANGQAVVLQPWSPAAFAGSVKVVQSQQLEILPVTLDEFSLALTHFGLGISEIMDIQNQAEMGSESSARATE